MGDLIRAELGLPKLNVSPSESSVTTEVPALKAKGILTFADVYGSGRGTLMGKVQPLDGVVPDEAPIEQKVVNGEELAPELITSIVNELPGMSPEYLRGFILALIYRDLGRKK